MDSHEWRVEHSWRRYMDQTYGTNYTGDNGGFSLWVFVVLGVLAVVTIWAGS